MKLIERLARDEVKSLCKFPVSPETDSPEAVERATMYLMGYMVGFRKAREMAADTLGQETYECTPQKLRAIGEEEAE